MTTAALILAAVLAALAVVFVARPFLREPATPDDTLASPSAKELERLRLLDARDRALAALKELEFDHRTGKISDADYEELVRPLRQEAAEALAALDSRPQARADGRARSGAPR